MEKAELITEQAIKAQVGSRRHNYSFFNLGRRLVWGDCEEPRACVDGCRKSLPHRESILLHIGDASYQS